MLDNPQAFRKTAEDPQYEEEENKQEHYEDPNFDAAWNSDDDEDSQQPSRQDIGETIAENDFVDEGELLPPEDEGGKIPYNPDEWEEVD